MCSYIAARGEDITRAIDPAEDQRGRKCDVRYLRWSWCAAGAGEDGMWVMGPFRGMRTATDRLQEVEYGTWNAEKEDKGSEKVLTSLTIEVIHATPAALCRHLKAYCSKCNAHFLRFIVSHLYLSPHKIWNVEHSVLCLTFRICTSEFTFLLVTP